MMEALVKRVEDIKIQVENMGAKVNDLEDVV